LLLCIGRLCNGRCRLNRLFGGTNRANSYQPINNLFDPPRRKATFKIQTCQNKSARVFGNRTKSIFENSDYEEQICPEGNAPKNLFNFDHINLYFLNATFTDFVDCSSHLGFSSLNQFHKIPFFAFLS